MYVPYSVHWSTSRGNQDKRMYEEKNFKLRRYIFPNFGKENTEENERYVPTLCDQSLIH